MEGWRAGRPAAALMGEFSAGKSSLLNLVLGDEGALPAGAVATNLPPVWMTCGPRPAARVLRRDGRLAPSSLDEVLEAADPEVLAVRLEHPAPALERIDLIDTPGISDPRRDAAALRFLTPYLDFVLWCTAAEQAWRRSEARFWQAMPAALRVRSHLVVTRMDLMASPRDRAKVLARLRAETARDFAAVLPLATPDAARAREGGDAALWASSGGEALEDALEAAVAAAEDAARRRADPTGPGPEAGTAGEDGEAGGEGRPLDVAALLSRRKNEQPWDHLERMNVQLTGQEGVSTSRRAVLAAIARPVPRDAADWPRAMVQLERELTDHARDAWHVLQDGPGPADPERQNRRLGGRDHVEH
ncbi:dynamin family protein [Hasllibacter halocynthiae]|uniref:Dynamin family protein n=2 Tax=Hasllibacter halocynthiae TaxID=595589 RepID=A0A2T0WYY5_9RHOB|nr:dynamin family protein [Hasllibacter halocynthiae]